MTPTHDPIQQALINARNTQILDAATKVFSEKGFHRATIKDIAQVAGIADGTIYNYFKNKQGLLLGILDRLNQSDQRENDFTQGMSLDFAGFFKVYLRQRIALLFPNIEVFRAVLPEVMVNPDLRDLYFNQVLAPSFAIAEQMLQARIDAGEMAHVEAKMASRVLAATLFGTIMLALLGDEYVVIQQDNLPDVLAQIVVDGMLGCKE